VSLLWVPVVDLSGLRALNSQTSVRFNINQNLFISFDVEHSAMFNVFGWDTLYTYAPIEPLKILYLDGSSAAKSDEGYFDLQVALASGAKKFSRTAVVQQDAQMITAICDLVKPYGISGLVRLETTFEVAYCDVSDGGLQLIRSRDIWNPSGEILICLITYSC
jgi:hypothetical protein